MKRRAAHCLFVAPAMAWLLLAGPAPARAASPSLLDHLVAFHRIVRPQLTVRPPIKVVVFAMEMDVTGDDVPEVFLASTWATSGRGLSWVVYTRQQWDGRYKPLGTLQFAADNFMYIPSASLIFTAGAAGAGLGADYRYYRIGPAGVREVTEAVRRSIPDDEAAAIAWNRDRRPPVYAIELDALGNAGPAEWRDTRTGNVAEGITLGKLDATVTESGDCSAEKFLDDYRRAGCAPQQAPAAAPAVPPRPHWYDAFRVTILQTGFQTVLGLIFLGCLVLAVLSLWWTRWRERKILREALGRNVREEEETSLKTWMTLRGDQLANAEQELARNPFDRPLDALESLGDRLSGERKDQ